MGPGREKDESKGQILFAPLRFLVRHSFDGGGGLGAP
jgi:hypothetical protein